MKTFLQFCSVALTVVSFAACGNNSKKSDTGSMNGGSTGTDMSGTSTSAAGGTGQSTTTEDDTSVSNFVSRAMIINQIKVRAGKLAQQKASSREVKAFAGQMVADHTIATNELQALASKKNIAFPAMTDASYNFSSKGGRLGSGKDSIINNLKNSQTGNNTGNKTKAATDTGAGGSPATSANVANKSYQDKLNRLKQRAGGDFDREYMKMMVEDHAETISAFEKASTDNDAEIKNYALKMLPILKEHDRNARTILANLGN